MIDDGWIAAGALETAQQEALAWRALGVCCH